MSNVDRRRFIRHLLVNPLEFQVSDKEQFEKTTTVDMSEGGLLFMSKQDVAPGAAIKINMPLYNKVFNIKAQVIHCTKDEESGLFNIGVTFINYADAFKVKLIEQIYLIEEYRVLRSLQLGKEMTIQEASKEWIEKYSERFQKLYW